MKYKKSYRYTKENGRTLKTVRITNTLISNNCLITYEEDRPETIQKVFYTTEEKRRIATKN